MDMAFAARGLTAQCHTSGQPYIPQYFRSRPTLLKAGRDFIACAQ